MRRSVIVHFAMGLLLPILLVVSLILYWRGHQLPGGGFIGGLVAAAGIAVFSWGRGGQAARRILFFAPEFYLFFGVLLAVLSSVLAPLVGREFFTGLWGYVPLIGKVGSPMLFDLGVYFVVFGVGSTLSILLQEDA
jgi:multicomponent Na+:H+ antiporter subunit B